MDVKWGKNRESVVRPCRFGQKDRIELVTHAVDAPAGVLHWPDVYMMPLTKEQAKRLGVALIRVANNL